MTTTQYGVEDRDASTLPAATDTPTVAFLPTPPVTVPAGSPAQVGSPGRGPVLAAVPAPPALLTADLVTLLGELASWDEAAGTSMLTAVRDALRELPTARSEGVCVARIAVLEEIKAAVTAAQVRQAVAFRTARLDRETAEGIPASRQGKGLGDEIALARNESPFAGSRFLGLAVALNDSMPNALAALTAGRVNERAVGLLRSEVETLSEPDRERVDTALAPEYGDLPIKELTARARALAYQADPNTVLKRFEKAVSERRVSVRPAADGMAFLTALLPTPQAFACKKALRDAAATANTTPTEGGVEMPLFYGSPAQQAAQQTAWLADHANDHAGGVVPRMPRSAAQAEADILVERLTGQTTPEAINVELVLLMTDHAALGVSRANIQAAIAAQHAHETDPPSSPGGTTHTANERTEPDEEPGGRGHNETAPDPDPSALDASDPSALDASVLDDLDAVAALNDEIAADPTTVSAWVPELGPLPAAIARDLLDPRHDPPSSPGSRERVHLRRILTDPVTGNITHIDTRARAFTGALRYALLIRDDVCQTPGCGAPIRHLDHTHPYKDGGTTSAANGTGLCARCNYIKQNPGWRHRRDPATGQLTVTTPTGHTRTSRPPQPIPRL